MASPSHLTDSIDAVYSTRASELDSEVPTVPPSTRALYGEACEFLPATALGASLGCANPTAFAQIKPGDTILDLGCGGGIDSLLAARETGPDGFVFGLDSSEEMLGLAERGRQETNLLNIRWLKGRFDEIPLPENSVDVVIANCAISLAENKRQVLREAHRVTRPGGRLAMADFAATAELEPSLHALIDTCMGCAAGSVLVPEFVEMLRVAGFREPSCRVLQVLQHADLQVLSTTPVARERRITDSAHFAPARDRFGSVLFTATSSA